MVLGLNHSNAIPTARSIRCLLASIRMQLVMTLCAYTLEVAYIQCLRRVTIHRAHVVYCSRPF